MISNILEKKTLRLDIYLYYIRIFKSRSIATKFVLTNRLRISGQVTQKPHKMISVGDVLTITINDNNKYGKNLFTYLTTYANLKLKYIPVFL